MKHILKAASLYLRERALDEKIQALREQRHALRDTLRQACDYSSECQRSPDRTDITFDISLAEYLTTFAKESPTPTAHAYAADDRVLEGVGDQQAWRVVARGTKHYLAYPRQWVGTLPTTPPTHVWVKSSTEAVWAKGDPKPVTPEPVAEPATA